MPSVLIVCGDGAEMHAAHLREQSWHVDSPSSLEGAWAVIDQRPPDVVIVDPDVMGSYSDAHAFIEACRFRLDDATSIIVIAEPDSSEERQQMRAAGADLLLVRPVQAADLAYEVKRALILRRSGRRLSWNWPANARSDHDAARRTGRAS